MNEIHLISLRREVDLHHSIGLTERTISAYVHKTKNGREHSKWYYGVSEASQRRLEKVVKAVRND